MKLIICIAITTIFTAHLDLFLSSAHAAHKKRGETLEPLASLPGVWKQKGYGNLYEITQTHFRSYEISSKHCLLTGDIELELVAPLLPKVFVSKNRRFVRTDSSSVVDDIHSYGYRKISDLPSSCKYGITEPTLDPVSNFDVFWHTFNENYAYFEERNVDWQKQYDDNLWRVEQLGTSPADQKRLFEIMGNMIRTLDRDGHSSIEFSNPENPNDTEEVRAFSLRELETRLRSEFEVSYSPSLLRELFTQQDETEDFDAFVAYMFSEVFKAQLETEHQEIIRSYIDAHSLSSAANDQIRWGKTPGNIGYLQVQSMTEFLENNDIDAQFAALDTAMNQVLIDLHDTDAMIIDIRSNFGGYDAAGLAIASRFYDRKRRVFRKKARRVNGFTNRVRVAVSPTENTYVKPIYLLTSAQTASAAETFSVAMKALPYVKVIGENTNGIFSDMLTKTLPNGWSFSLSNEVYTDTLGVSYEYVGVPPDVPALMYDRNFRAQGKDSSIEAVLELAENNSKAVCEYTLQHSWHNGFVASIRVTNTSSQIIDGWSIGWHYDDNTTIRHIWGAELESDPPYFYASNRQWNKTIEPSESVSIGVLGKHSGTTNTPIITGELCD